MMNRECKGTRCSRIEGIDGAILYLVSGRLKCQNFGGCFYGYLRSGTVEAIVGESSATICAEDEGKTAVREVEIAGAINAEFYGLMVYSPTEAEEHKESIYFLEHADRLMMSIDDICLSFETMEHLKLLTDRTVLGLVNLLTDRALAIRSIIPGGSIKEIIAKLKRLDIFAIDYPEDQMGWIDPSSQAVQNTHLEMDWGVQ